MSEEQEVLEKQDVDVAKDEGEEIHPLDADKNFLVSNSIKFGKTLEGMDKETFKAQLDYARFLDLLYYIKVFFPDALAEPIEEATYEKIVNVFGNQNIPVSWNETQKCWQCILFLKGGVLHIYDNNGALAALRAYIFIRSAKWYQNDNLVNNFIGLWQKANDTKEDPYFFTEKDANEAAKALGTSLEEIEDKVKDLQNKAVEEAKGNSTVH